MTGSPPFPYTLLHLEEAGWWWWEGWGGGGGGGGGGGQGAISPPKSMNGTRGLDDSQH